MAGDDAPEAETAPDDDHSGLLSALDSHNLEFTMSVDEASGADPFAFEVATDEEFEDVVFDGVVTDGESIRVHDYTVSVDLDDRLEPDSTYYYRFIYHGVSSRVGRCRTLPAPTASPESVRFAVLTCQNCLNGYISTLRYVAEADVDSLVHVGDFIYESDEGHFRGLGSVEYPDRELSLPSGHDRVRSLEDYRYLYRTYRRDEHHQAAMESHTLIAGWDDHDLVNDV